jgi:Holliday junction resolvasome RuvABC endonuclease subunit
MERLPQTILGISPGTRSLGIAIIRDGELLDARIKTFPGKWSDSKRKTIVGAILRFLEDFSVTDVTLKTIHEARGSAALNQLIYDIKDIAEKRKLKFVIHTINDLKKYLLKENNGRKEIISTYIVEKFPELYSDAEKERKNRHNYYIKMFEAVTCALLIKVY